MIVIDDFVMLGTTVPEPRSDGRVFVCSAGVSGQLRTLLRVYPLARSQIPRRWHTYTVRLERPPLGHDSRWESWQVAGNRSQTKHHDINQVFVEQCSQPVSRDHRFGLLDKLRMDSIQESNKRRLSLAIVRPLQAPEVTWEHRPDDPLSPQLALFDDVPPEVLGSARFEWIPRLRFRDGGGEHHLMIRDWGCFELMRKQGYEYARENLPNALHIGSDSALLVGNLNNQRSAWLVISILNGVVGAPSLFDDDAPPDRP